MKAARWDTTDSDDLAKLHHGYVVNQRCHAEQLGIFMSEHPGAADLVRKAELLVPIGPGFGEEIRYLTDDSLADIIAVEINRNAHGPLSFERPWLRVVEHIDDVPTQSGRVVFTTNFVLAQPSLSSDEAMQKFAASLVRIAPEGFTIFSVLPNSPYLIKSRFAPADGLYGDDLLVEHLRQIGCVVTIDRKLGSGSPFTRLALIEVKPK